MQEKWMRDMPQSDEEMKMEALVSRAEKQSVLDNFLAQEAMSIDEMRRVSDFVKNRVDILEDQEAPEALLGTLEEVSDLLDKQIYLLEVYNRNLKVVAQGSDNQKNDQLEKYSIEYVDKTDSDPVEIERLEKAIEANDVEIRKIGSILNHDYPQEYDQMYSYIYNAQGENHLN